jgi:hypothetical protein
MLSTGERVFKVGLELFQLLLSTERESLKREIVKNRVVPTTVEHWERVFKVRLGLFQLMLSTGKRVLLGGIGVVPTAVEL